MGGIYKMWRRGWRSGLGISLRKKKKKKKRNRNRKRRTPGSPTEVRSPSSLEPCWGGVLPDLRFGFVRLPPFLGVHGWVFL